jgi:hypothetical protein
MSIFKSITTAVTGEELINSSNYSANANITISQIKVTNHGITGAITVSVFIDKAVGEYIFKTSVPQDTTLIFDNTFSYPQTETLKVTTSGDSNITIVVN